MVDSGLGQTDLAEIRKLGPQTRAVPKAKHRDVRQPRPALGPVDAKPLEAPVHIGRERGRVLAVVVEDEHADAASLAVGTDAKQRSPGTLGRRPQLGDDRCQLPCGAASEKRQGDVKVLGRDHPPPRDRRRLPGRDSSDRCGRKPEGEKEAERPTAGNASRGTHTRV
jgi:hypothetical protein